MGRAVGENEEVVQQPRAADRELTVDPLLAERRRLEEEIGSAGWPFVTVGREIDSYSGWKLHVFCPDTEAVKIALARLHADAVEYGWGMKAATRIFFLMAQEGHPQYGKGITIYLPKREQAEDDTDWIIRLLEGYPFAGEIAGDEMLTPYLGRRFEFAEDPGRDVSREEHRRLYQPSAAYRAHHG